MANGKKGFILYNSWINPIKELTHQEAGILFENIFVYVNNGNDFELMTDNVNNLYLDIINQIEFEWAKFNPETEKYHWNYKGGITNKNKAIRNSTPYKIWRNKVFKRDEYTCQYCDTVGGELNAHHMMPFATYEHLRLEVDNGLTLCKECHKQAHK